MNVVLIGLCLLAQATPANRIPLENFEKDAPGWGFIGGEEFPGAKGSFSIDPTQAHQGARSGKLSADFSGGGAYVGLWKDLAVLQGRECSEIHLWIKSSGVTRIGVRLADATDQCHQSSVAIKPGADWQELVLRIRDLVGGE